MFKCLLLEDFFRLPTVKNREAQKLVPGTGLEPAHLAALDPKSSVSAIPPPGRIVR